MCIEKEIKEKLINFLMKNMEESDKKLSVMSHQDFLELKKRDDNDSRFITIGHELDLIVMKLYKKSISDEERKINIASELHRIIKKTIRTRAKEITLEAHRRGKIDTMQMCTNDIWLTKTEMDKLTYQRGAVELHKMGYTMRDICAMPHYDVDDEYIQKMKDAEENPIIIYIFEEYRDNKGYGTIRKFDIKDEAIQAAKKEWSCLSEKDKQSYRIDSNGLFCVYKAEIPIEEWVKMLDSDGCPEETENFYMTEIINDFLKGE